MIDKSTLSLILLTSSLLTYLLIPPSQLSSTPSTSSFTEWKSQFTKSYDSPYQDLLRQSIFLQNLNKIDQHNAVNKDARLGWTQFMDLTQEEFARKYLRASVARVQLRREEGNGGETLTSTQQVNIDWVAAGAVTPVKNQGTGNVVAIVAAEAMEAITKLRDGQLRAISEQNLIDCLGQTSFHQYFAFVAKNGTNYAPTPKTCSGPFKISSDVSTSGCSQLLDNLAQGPVAVAVDANNWAFYKSGIFENCGGQVNHSVLVVGVTDTYWKVKNSWGTGWGESGYIRLKAGNTCAVCLFGGRPKG